MPHLLNHCNIDGEHVLLREWAIFAVRNVCAGNMVNQAFIENLQFQGTGDTPLLSGTQLSVIIDPETGKPTVTARKPTTQRDDDGGNGGAEDEG